MVRKVPTSNPVVATTPIGLIRSKPTAISNTSGSRPITVEPVVIRIGRILN
jgi:hypothetical protein